MIRQDAKTILSAAAHALPGQALLRLGEAFDLSDFEMRLVMLAFAYEVDPDVTEAVAAVSGDMKPLGVPVWLANMLLDADDWQATASAAGLRRWRILLADGPAPRAQLRLRLAEAVTDAMTGTYALDAALEGIFNPLQGSEKAMPEGADVLAKSLSLQTSGGLSPVVIAPWSAGIDHVGTCLKSLGLNAYRIETARLVGRTDRIFELQRLFERDSAIRPAALVAEMPTDLATQEALSALLDGLAAHVVLVGDTTPAGLRRATHRLEKRGFERGDATSLWKQALGRKAATRLNGSVERAAAHFDLDMATIAHTAAAIREPVERQNPPGRRRRYSGVLQHGRPGRSRAIWPG
jgi:hypothetical protein